MIGQISGEFARIGQIQLGGLRQRRAETGLYDCRVTGQGYARRP